MTFSDADAALSGRLGANPRRVSFAYCREGKIVTSHLWPLRPGYPVNQFARARHSFAVLETARLPAPRWAWPPEIEIASLPRNAVLACVTLRRKDPTGERIVVAVSAASDAIAALAGAVAPVGVAAPCARRCGALAALAWIFDDEGGVSCDADVVATYVSNVSRPVDPRRELNPQNAAFLRAVAPSAGARALLWQLGFRPSGDVVRVDRRAGTRLHAPVPSRCICLFVRSRVPDEQPPGRYSSK